MHKRNPRCSGIVDLPERTEDEIRVCLLGAEVYELSGEGMLIELGVGELGGEFGEAGKVDEEDGLGLVAVSI